MSFFFEKIREYYGSIGTDKNIFIDPAIKDFNLVISPN